MMIDGLQKRPNFIPKNALTCDVTKLLFNDDNADVSFQMKEEVGSSGARIYAHRIILNACAPALASLCENCDKTNPAPISQVDPTIFKLLISYMYGVEISQSRWECSSKEILEAADRYGIINLKIEAEARYVKTFQLTVDNAVDTLLYADSKHCALLKEAAVAFIAENATAPIASDLFEKVPQTENIFREIFSVFGRNKHGASGGTKYKCMSVNDLRRNLYKKGLDFDGSREMLIARLENQSRTKKRKASL